MPEYGLSNKLDELFDEVNIPSEKKKELRENIQNNLNEPVRIIGAGQTGVGKSTLLRSIFAIEDEDEDIPDGITTDATSAETEQFRSFHIENSDGFKIEFTDGPGLGESLSKDEELIPKWVEEIQKHDLLYWVLDASSRDIAHIQSNMKEVLDATNYRDKTVVVLNKVDQIELEREDYEEGVEGWNEKYNVPTDELEEQIKRRTDDIIKKLDKVGIPEEQIVACSALKRWNHGKVLNTLIENLPPEKQIKVSANRDVEEFTDLLSDEVLKEIQG